MTMDGQEEYSIHLLQYMTPSLPKCNSFSVTETKAKDFDFSSTRKYSFSRQPSSASDKVEHMFDESLKASLVSLPQFC